jgi:hypothetical protein
MTEDELRSEAEKIAGGKNPYPKGNIAGAVLSGILSASVILIVYGIIQSFEIPKFWADTVFIILGGGLGWYLYHEKKKIYFHEVDKAYQELKRK